MTHSAEGYSQPVGTALPLSDESFVFVSGLRTEAGAPLTGNTLRRACELTGAGACAATCQLAALENLAPVASMAEVTTAKLEDGFDAHRALDRDPTACADNNVLGLFNELGIPPDAALMVSVGEDAVGFLDDPAVRANITRNPHGWGEVPGFNAFFMRHTDTVPLDGAGGSLVRLLGARLADSGFVVVGMKDSDGTAVSGIIHSTRTNMPGREHRREYGGVQQSFMRYVLGEAIAHYGARPEEVLLRVAAAVGPEAWQKRYRDTAKLEMELPGWADEGLIENRTDPAWRPGREVGNPATNERDVLWPDYPRKVTNEVFEAAEAFGITQIETNGMLDPGKPQNGIIHSSANRARLAPAGDPTANKNYRDAYVVVVNPLSAS